MPKSNQKGGGFEREMAKQFSQWWTKGARDDVFWRSSQSGGRATMRSKRGKTTAGSYGDLAALDPVGEPLLRFMTLELKRGSTWGGPAELLEAPRRVKAQRPFERAIQQAIESHKQAGSLGWALVCRRDRCFAMMYLEARLYRVLKIPYFPCIRFELLATKDDGWEETVKFAGMRLETFFQWTRPSQIVKAIS